MYARFVLSSKKRTCYYYERQTDLKPKGYFFLNGCTVAPCKDVALERKHVSLFENLCWVLPLKIIIKII